MHSSHLVWCHLHWPHFTRREATQFAVAATNQNEVDRAVLSDSSLQPRELGRFTAHYVTWFKRNEVSWDEVRWDEMSNLNAPWIEVYTGWEETEMTSIAQLFSRGFHVLSRTTPLLNTKQVKLANLNSPLIMNTTPAGRLITVWPWSLTFRPLGPPHVQRTTCPVCLQK